MNLNLLEINSYLKLDILRYLDVKSLINIFRSSKLNSIFVHEIFARSPSIRTAIFRGQTSQLLHLLNEIQAPPTMAIIMDATSGNRRISDVCDNLIPRLPKSMNILYTQCTSVQAASLTSGESASNVHYFDESESEEENSCFSVILGAFPNSYCCTMLVLDRYFNENDNEVTDEILIESGLVDLNEDWRLFIIYSSEFPYVETVVSALQKRYPQAAILGGITSGVIGVVSANRVARSEGGLACLAIRGNIPMRVIVSRGVEATSDEYGVMSEDIKVERSVNGGTAQHISVGALHDKSGNQSVTPAAVITDMTDRVRSIASPMMLMVGIRPSLAEPFYLVPSSRYPVVHRRLQIPLDKYMGIPKSLRFFALTPDACRRDVRTSLQLAKERLQAEGQIPMATIMFSCSARGPQSDSIFSEDQVDAKTYVSVFPDVPLIGSYMNGEIGPHAGAGITAETVLRTGTACVQGFTAVFGIFTVPTPASTIDIISNMNLNVEELNTVFQRVFASYCYY